MADALPERPTLGDYQAFMKKVIAELGFESETITEVFMLMMEETGEFAKAVRKVAGVKTDKASRQHKVEEEAADVFWLLLDLCNMLDIDLEKAFREKAAKNLKRSWA